MTSSNGNIFRVTGPLCGEFTGPGEFPTQRPVTRSFDVYFDLRLNKRLCKQSWGWWFETLLCPLWRHSNECVVHHFLPLFIWDIRVCYFLFNSLECSAKTVGICHYNDVIMSAMASQITSLTIVYSTVYSRRRSKKHQRSASLAFVGGIHRGPVNSPNKGPVTRKMFPFDDIIMVWPKLNRIVNTAIDNSYCFHSNQCRNWILLAVVSPGDNTLISPARFTYLSPSVIDFGRKVK